MSAQIYDEFRDRFQFDRDNWSRIAKGVPPVLLFFLAVFLAWKAYYTVKPHEQAVVMRFGEYHSTTGAGLHFMIPLVDNAVMVETSEKSMRLPMGIIQAGGSARQGDKGGFSISSTSNRSAPQGPTESLILTGDLYAAIVEWNVVWRVSEPEKYLFSIDSGDIDETIASVARSVMHRVVGDYSADEILTGKREEIGQKAFEETQQVLNQYDCGITIIAIQMQRVTPPDRVKPAFDEVNASIQQKQQSKNEADQESNRLLPQAEAKRDKLTREAEGYAARRRAEAEGEISALLAKYRAYQLAPDVTRQRMYLETMEEVITNSGSKTILDSQLKGLLPLLNVDGGNSPNTATRPEVTR